MVSFEAMMELTKVVEVELGKGSSVGRAITELATGMVSTGLGEKVSAGVAITIVWTSSVVLAKMVSMMELTKMVVVELGKGSSVGRAITELATGMVSVGLGEKVIAGVAITRLDV